jgi:hypothetical protein
MARFDDLPADQKAVLQLVLRQGRTYEQIATLLKIAPGTVRDRALAALDAIGPERVTGLDEDREDEIGDHLLGQQDDAQRAATRAYLATSQPGRDWARAVAAELSAAGLADEDALPQIPADPPAAEAAPAPAGAVARGGEPQRSSRLGGVLLLVGGAIAIAAVVLVLVNVIGGNDDNGSGSTATEAAATTTTGTDSTADVVAQINLTPPGGGKKPLGVANIVQQSGKRAIAVVGQDLPASGHYVLWLRNGDKVRFLGFFPPVSDTGSAKGRLQGLVAAPTDLDSYKEMLVSREASSTPKRPTNIILRGSTTG